MALAVHPTRMATRRELAAVIAVGLLARLPLIGVSLALVLLVRDVGLAYATTGIVTGAYVLGMGLASPVLGRVVDRAGPLRVLVLSATLSAGALTVLALSAGSIPVPALVAIAALAGASTPPLTAVLRATLPRLAEGGTLRTVYSLEAALQETIFVVGPVVVVVLVALMSPAAALVACAALVVAGHIGFALTIASHVAPPAPHPGGTPLAGAGLRWLALTYGLMGVTFGGIELATIAAMDEAGSRGLSGLVLATWAFGSLAGGLIVARRARRDPAHRLVPLTLALALLGLPLAVLSGVPPLLAGGLLAQGAIIAPTLGTIYELVPQVSPAGLLTEAFAWTTSAVYAGVAAGSSLAGVLIGAHGPEAAFLIAVAAPLLAAASGRLVRREASRTA